jgi:hypothetical protein
MVSQNPGSGNPVSGLFHFFEGFYFFLNDFPDDVRGDFSQYLPYGFFESGVGTFMHHVLRNPLYYLIHVLFYDFVAQLVIGRVSGLL